MTTSTAPTRSYQPVSIETSPEEVMSGTCHDDYHRSSVWKLYTSFWMLGLLNNTGYVIMIASAKEISEGGTALVFLANVVPGLIIKSSAPYWFDHVSYNTRLSIATMCMMASFVLVASTSGHGQLWVQLVGVGLGSLQGSLGEASVLAMAGKSDGKESGGKCLTSFSSGTGMAGVFGFFWKWFWNDWCGFSLSTTLWMANILAVAYWRSYQYAKSHPLSSSSSIDDFRETRQDDDSPPKETHALNLPTASTAVGEGAYIATTSVVIPVSDMTGGQRLALVLSLWPYMLPLFIVYAAEYALQSGTWTAIGFPLDDMQARDRFFEFSNWMYQAGVFLSRSSGTLFTAPMWLLWLMPGLQFANLAVYMYVASHPTTSILYQPSILYVGSLYSGLLGGAVYIHGYKRICADLPLEHREFALSATSVAECLGIVVADALGLVIQACLYQVNQLEGALLTCPMKNNR